MTRKITLIIVMLALAYNSHAQQNFSITINTSSIPNLTKLKLEVLENNRLFRKVDSCVFLEGKAGFKGVLNQPANFGRFNLMKDGKLLSADFMIDTGNISLTLEISDKKLVIKDLDTESNRILNEMQQIQNNALIACSQTLKTQQAYYVLPPDLSKQTNLAAVKRLYAYPNNYASMLVLYWLSYFARSADYSEAILSTFEGFNLGIKNSEIGKKLYAREAIYLKAIKETNTGKKVLEFKVKDASGQWFSNQSLQGQNYIIVFSATWCLPCQKQLPMLKKIYQNYQSKGLKVIYFNQDDDVIRWKKHIADNKLSWINVSERVKFKDSKISEVFGVTAVPTCFVVNKLGHIVYNSEQSDTGLEKLEATVAKLFK